MAIQDWSDEITVVDLGDDPLFTDELTGLIERLEKTPSNVAVNFAAVSFVNSSNIAKLLRLRKTMLAIKCQMVMCGINADVWGVFVVTGLDKIFRFTNDISTALATLQLSGEDLA